jgi:hypothetical protein
VYLALAEGAFSLAMRVDVADALVAEMLDRRRLPHAPHTEHALFQFADVQPPHRLTRCHRPLAPVTPAAASLEHLLWCRWRLLGGLAYTLKRRLYAKHRAHACGLARIAPHAHLQRHARPSVLIISQAPIFVLVVIWSAMFPLLPFRAIVDPPFKLGRRTHGRAFVPWSRLGAEQLPEAVLLPARPVLSLISDPQQTAINQGRAKSQKHEQARVLLAAFKQRIKGTLAGIQHVTAPPRAIPDTALRSA